MLSTSFVFRNVRNLATSVSSPLIRLRKQTGYPIHLCKKALEVSNQDLKLALEWAKNEALSSGIEKAQKLSSRRLNSGLVGLIQEYDQAAFVEMSAETDFVTKNKDFQMLVANVTATLLSQTVDSRSGLITRSFTGADLLPMTSRGEDKRSIADQISLSIGTIGENMSLVRGLRLDASPLVTMLAETTSARPIIATYVHNATVVNECQMGRYVSAVMLSRATDDAAENTDDLSLEEIGSRLAKHVVAFCPVSVGYDEWLADPVVDSEVDPADDFTVEPVTADSGKSEEVDSTTTESATEEEPHPDDVENTDDLPKTPNLNESRLYFQILSGPEGLRVGDWLNEHGVTVHEFVRFETGELGVQ